MPKLFSSHAFVAIAAASFSIGCASAPPPAPAVVRQLPGTDTIPVPIDELGSRTYHGVEGGLYPGGANVPPAGQDAAGIARRNAIRPLDVNGIPTGAGRYVLMSVGAGDASAAWCSVSSAPPCESWSFTGRSIADPEINHGPLVIVNGAIPGAALEMWSAPTAKNYNRIRDTRLAPLGLSEMQVQAIWMSVQDSAAALPISATAADAGPTLQKYGATIRALKTRYPNLQLLFIASRGYRGYSDGGEPAGYESGFIVKWVIESQIRQRGGQGSNPDVGDLGSAAAPWLAWSPYFWSRGALPGGDGVSWVRSDFDSTGTALSQSGQAKIGALLLDFFKRSSYTRCWFVVGPVCG